MKVLFPDSLSLSLPESDGAIEYCRYSAQSADFSNNSDAQMLVLWGNSDANMKAAISQLPNLQLVQTLAAGPDHVLGAGFTSEIAIASGRGLHDVTVVEHALTLILSLVRKMDSLREKQSQSQWDSGYLAAQADPKTESLYTLNKSKVLIYGFGSIAAQLTPILRTLGAEVTGVARNAGTRHGVSVITASDAQARLKEFDVVLSLLPYSSDVEKFFGANFFNSMKSSALFINVGRGKTVDESALVEALTSEKIRAAAVDVTYIEPLPSDSPLWKCKNLTITPHIAGGRPRGSEELIRANALALLNGDELRNLVAR